MFDFYMAMHGYAWKAAVCLAMGFSCKQDCTGLFHVHFDHSCCLFTQADYYEAVCKAIDPKRKELVACFPKDAGLDEACFKIKYDILIMGVSPSPVLTSVQELQVINSINSID
jgi:hypothetical protein